MSPFLYERIHPAGDEPQRRLGDELGHESHALPGIVLQLAHGFLEMGAGNQLDAFEPGIVQLLGDRQHHARGHILRPQALMAVADRSVDETNGVHIASRRISNYKSQISNSMKTERISEPWGRFFVTFLFLVSIWLMRPISSKKSCLSCLFANLSLALSSRCRWPEISEFFKLSIQPYNCREMFSDWFVRSEI